MSILCSDGPFVSIFYFLSSCILKRPYIWIKILCLYKCILFFVAMIDLWTQNYSRSDHPIISRSSNNICNVNCATAVNLNGNLVAMCRVILHFNQFYTLITSWIIFLPYLAWERTVHHAEEPEHLLGQGVQNKMVKIQNPFYIFLWVTCRDEDSYR